MMIFHHHFSQKLCLYASVKCGIMFLFGFQPVFNYAVILVLIKVEVKTDVAMFKILLVVFMFGGLCTHAAIVDNSTASSAFHETLQNSVEALVILSPSHTLKCTSYDLTWKAPIHARASKYFIRYKQAFVPSGVNKTLDEWEYITLPGNLTQYSIRRLKQQSIYHIEIICEMQNLVRSRPAMSSFRTGCQDSLAAGGTNTISPPIKESDGKDMQKIKVLKSPLLSIKRLSDTTLTLMWNIENIEETDIGRIKVEMKVNGKGKSWKSKIPHISPIINRQNITDLRKGFGYKFRLTVEYENGESINSNIVRFFTTRESIQPPLNSPQMLYVDLRNASQLCIKVESGGQTPDVEGYFVKLVKNNVGLKSRLASVHGNLICILFTFKTEIPYSFKIQSFNIHGRSPYSLDIFFTLPVGYKKKTFVILNSTGATLYPNIPASTNKPHHEVRIAPYPPLRNMTQRDIAILIAGLAMVLVVIVLVISAIIYNRLKIQDKKSAMDPRTRSPLPTSSRDMSGCTDPKSRHYDEICLPSSNSSGQIGCTYHDTDIRNCGSKTAPLWWVRGLDGEFCHIIPKDSTRPITQGLPPSGTSCVVTSQTSQIKNLPEQQPNTYSTPVSV